MRRWWLLPILTMAVPCSSDDADLTRTGDLLP
jgi:hypothetical protein